MPFRRLLPLLLLGFLPTLAACQQDGLAGQWDSPDRTTTAAAESLPMAPDIGSPEATVGAVDVQVVRFTGAPGDTTVVASGVPLPPGALGEAQLGRVRLFINGSERPIAASALAGRHPDGSLRSVLVRFLLPPSSPNEMLVGRLTLDSDRPPARDWQPIATSAMPGGDGGGGALPPAALLPYDPAYLVSTDLVGPTRTAAHVRAFGGHLARFEDDFVKHADQFWKQNGDAWEENYYDRVLIYYAWWVRTGKAEYWRRATQMAVNYRRTYLESNDYRASPHWSQLEGLEKHYLLTGDERSRTAVARVADVFYEAFQQRGYLGPDTPGSENRIQARVLQAQLLAQRLGAGGPASRDRLERALDLVLASQSADGAYRFAHICGESLNYMTGVLNDVLIGYHTYYRPDPRIPVAVRRAVDWLWETQWVPAERAFKYASGPCDGVGGPEPSPDLNLVFVSSIAWLQRETRDARYGEIADRVFQGGVGRSYLAGSKQFNENYYSSFKYLGYRD